MVVGAKVSARQARRTAPVSYNLISYRQPQFSSCSYRLFKDRSLTSLAWWVNPCQVRKGVSEVLGVEDHPKNALLLEILTILPLVPPLLLVWNSFDPMPRCAQYCTLSGRCKVVGTHLTTAYYKPLFVNPVAYHR